jgi:hypothetical protein
MDRKHELFRQMLAIEFEELERYIRASLAALETNDVDLEQKYQELESRTKAKGDEGFSREESFRFLSAVPFMLKHSLFISVYSFMEYSLKTFCELTAFQMNQHVRRVADFEKVHQYYSFLINDVQLDKRKVEEEWLKLNIFRDLRNSIVHYNSTIGKNISAKTYAFIKEDSRIEFEEPRGFKIKDDTLILELIGLSKRFLFTLMEEYQKKYFPE